MERKNADLNEAVKLLANLTEAHTAALFLAEPDSETLTPAAWFSFSKVFRQGPVPVGEGLVGYVFRSNKIVDVDRYQQDSTLTGLYAKNEEIKAFLAFPVGGLGVLVVDSKARQIFGEKEKKLVKNFADFIWHLLVNRQVACREEQYGKILDLIYEVENATLSFLDPSDFFAKVLAAGAAFTGLGLGFICLMMPGKERYLVEAVTGSGISTMRGNQYPADSGLVGWVMQNTRPLSHGRVRPKKNKSYLISPDEPIRGYDTFVGVPLTSFRKFIGVWAYAGAGPAAVGEEDERGLMVAGHRVASAIEYYAMSRAVSA